MLHRRLRAQRMADGLRRYQIRTEADLPMRRRDSSDSYERDPIPWRVKNQLFTAQKGRCAYCGRTHRIRYLEIDHRWPVSRGGGDEIQNLQLLCTPCNMRKGIQSDEEFRSRYWRLLPDDDSIPYPPIPQDDFSEETAVHAGVARGPLHLSRAFRRLVSRASQRGGCGLVLAMMACAIVGHGSVGSRVLTTPKSPRPPTPAAGPAAPPPLLRSAPRCTASG